VHAWSPRRGDKSEGDIGWQRLDLADVQLAEQRQSGEQGLTAQFAGKGQGDEAPEIPVEIRIFA
jgi:hypothetical protein